MQTNLAQEQSSVPKISFVCVFLSYMLLFTLLSDNVHLFSAFHVGVGLIQIVTQQWSHWAQTKIYMSALWVRRRRRKTSLHFSSQQVTSNRKCYWNTLCSFHFQNLLELSDQKQYFTKLFSFLLLLTANGLRLIIFKLQNPKFDLKKEKKLDIKCHVN